MKKQDIAEAIIFAFQLQKTIDRIHSKHLIEQQIKTRQKQALKIQYLISANGRHIIQLFGYYLGLKLRDRTFFQMGKTFLQVLLRQEDLIKYCKTIWPDLGKYQLVILPLFRILKRKQGVISLREMDRFVQVCKKQMTPFIVQIKQHVPPHQLFKFIEKLQEESQKEDLTNSGFIQKIILQEFFKKQLKRANPQWPKQLYNPNNPNQINYRLLLSAKYLRAGQEVNKYILSKFVLKIIRVLKLAAKQNKKKDKKASKKKTGRVLKPTDKKNINEKLINKYIQANKPKKVQQNNRNQFFIKGLIEQLIQSIVQWKQNNYSGQNSKQRKIMKSVYITQPQFPQIQYDKPNIDINRIKFVGNNGLGVFVSNNTGYIIDSIKSFKKSQFQLNLSSLFKNSPIIQYQVYDNILYLLKQNGLLYSWPITGDTFLNQIQTSFIKPYSPPDSGTCNFLKIKDGMIAVNCTHQPYSRFQLYTLDLTYIGIVELSQSQFGNTYKLCQQSLCLQNNMKKKPLDKQINNLSQYKQLIANQIPQTNLILGPMLCSAYSERILNINKINQFIKWILYFKKFNQIILPQAMMNKLKTNKNDKDLIAYLLKLGYISEAKIQQVQKFQKLSCLKQGDINRKVQLLCLFQDAYLEPIKQIFLNKSQFYTWIGPACLMDLQLKQLTQSLQFTPEGKIDMSKLFHNQHYKRLVDSRYNRFVPEKYKYQQVPPVCVKQFLHIPNSQALLFTLCFPLQNRFHVINMLTGALLNTYDLSKFTPLAPILCTCQKNGYIFIVANRTITLWNSHQISNSKQLQPIKVWQNLQSNQIIDLVAIYQQSTIITLTKDCIKIWDFNQMCQKRLFSNIFQIKPGYKAIQLHTKSSSYSKNYKKRILIRENATSLFYFIAPNQLIVAGVVSKTKSQKYYIRSFAVNKFNVVINNEKQHYQIPTKLLKQLQMMAQKRKNLPPINKDKWLNQCQKMTQTRIVTQFKNKLKQINETTAKPSLKPQIQQKIGLLSHSISSIYNRNMFKDHQETHRMENIFKIITAQNVNQLKQILQPRFLQLYKFQKDFGYDISQMLQDCMSTKQKKAVNRSLYVLSLIQKYTRPLVQAGSKLAKFISQDRIKLDQKYIVTLFPTNLPLDARIITKVVNLLNSLSTPLTISIKIIQNYLPTRYRFLVPRYIKQIFSGKQSTQLNQYISNRYENQPTKQEISNKFSMQRADSGIQQFLFKRNLFKYAQQHVAYIFPLALNCNYSLIQGLMCLKVITEEQAFYFCIRQSLFPEQRLSAKIDMTKKPENQQYIEKVGQKIQQNITNRKLNIPYPKVSFSYFKDKLYSGQNCQYFFYGFLNGDRQQEQVVSENIQSLLKIIKKKLCLRYRISQWQWIMGQKIKILKPHYNNILQRFPLDFRIVSVSDLRTAFMSLIDQQIIYEDLIKRVAYACSSSTQKLDLWRKTLGNNLQTEGMWVNINFLLKFIQQYNPLLLQLDTAQTIQRKYNIKIPTCHMINRLAGDFMLLSISKFRELLTLNLTPLSLTNVNQIIQKYFKYGSKKINLFEIQNLISKDYNVIGRFLIDKYHRLDFQHRFTVINDKVSTSQLVQLLNSKALANYLFGDQLKGLPQFLPLQEVIVPLTNQIIGPAAQRISEAFSLSLHPQFLNLIQYNISKTASMPALALSQLIHNNHHEHPILVCLLKFMTNQSSSAQVINLNSLLNYFKKIKSEDLNKKYQKYCQKLKQKIKGRNMMQILLEQSQPQNLPFTIEDSPKSYIITQEHIQQILEQKHQWFINFKPYATIREMIDYLRRKQRQQQQLNKAIQLFTQNCVCRVGVNQIMLNLVEDCSFPQFYYRLKSNYKIMAKLQTQTILSIYQAIISASENKRCDVNGLRNLCQIYIPISKKAQWICALYDRQLIQNPLQNQQKMLDCELKIEKLKNLYDSINEKTKQIDKNIIKSTLNYHKFLINKYLSNDPTKIKHILQCMKQKKTDEAQTMLQAYGVVEQIHMQQLIKYFSQQNQHIQTSKFVGSQQTSVQEIKNLINLIKQNNKLFNYPILNLTKNQSYGSEKIGIAISQTKIYHQFLQNGMGQYYCTFHSLLGYCQSLLHSKITSNSNILKIQTDIRDFLIRMDMTHYKIYELLDLSNFDNIVKYLPQVVLKGTQSQDEYNDIKNIISQFAKPERTGIKYPINSNDFQKLLSDLNAKSQKQRKQYQYLYSQLDILGTGYVNINELPKYRGTSPSYLSPYVYIPSYIDQLSQKQKGDSYPLPSKYIGPILDPPQDKQLREKIKQKLMKYQIPIRKNQKTKLIRPDVCLAIMGQFGVAQNHQYQQFIKQRFTMLSNNLLDLSGIIDWLMQSLSQQDEDIQTKNRKQIVDQRFIKMSKIVELLQQNGGLYAYINKLKTQPPKDVENFYNAIIELSETDNNKLIQLFLFKTSQGQQKITIAQQLTKRIAQRFFRQAKKWDTFNNHFCKQIKNMAQMYYSLVFKFYHAHSNIDVHKIYHDISQNGQLTLLTLWRYVEDKGITGYSRADINQLFSAIDINSDKQLSYLQICQFWMACQQLFPRQQKQKYEAKTKIQQINNQAKNLFLQLCCIQLQNYLKQQLTLQDLVKFTNIPNVEKVDYIVRAVNSASVSRGPVSGAFDCKIQMSKSKLKILVDKMKVNLANNYQNLRSDLIINATQPQLHTYIKQNYNVQNLSKIIIMKYPKIGYQILQHFNDLYQMNPSILADKYKQIQTNNNNISLENNKKNNRFSIMSELVTNIQQTYRKHPFRISSYQHRYFGTSIAYSLMTEKVVTQIKSISNQVNQISNYLNKIQLPTVPLYYQLQHTHDNIHQSQKIKTKSLLKQVLIPFSYNIPIQITNSSLFQIKKTLYSKKTIKLGNIDRKQQLIVWRQINWKDTDLVCKSDNKVNIFQFAHLYNDPQISLIPINSQLSNRFKIQGGYPYKSQYVSLIQLQPKIKQGLQYRDQLIDRIMSLIKYMTDKLLYCYYKYAVTGLLVIPNNIMININNSTDLKFDNFLSALSLNPVAIKNNQQTVNYIDGIDSKYFMNFKRPFPPQTQLGTHTEQIDVFMLAHIVYALYRHKLNPTDTNIPDIIQKNCQQQPLWDWSSPLHQVATNKLKQKDDNNHTMSDKQYNLWVLLYQCSQHDWFMRPRLYQLQQVIDDYFDQIQPIKDLFQIRNPIQNLFNLLENNRLNDAKQMLTSLSIQNWQLSQIADYQILLRNLSDLDVVFIQHYNTVLQAYAKGNHNQDPDTTRLFLSIAVDYLLMIPATKGGFCFIVNATFKNILNQPFIKRYLSWCDMNWKIQQYEINKKIEKINMSDKLEALHKNSSFYHDIATLAQCRVTLAQGQTAKRSQTSKKVAFSFIYSCLVSNNINKIYAVYRSQILSRIYCYFSKQQLQPSIMSIFQIVTSCLNPTLAINRFKAVDEIYKVMMIISNSIKGNQSNINTSPTKTSTLKTKLNDSINKSNKQSQVRTSKVMQNQSIVSMQDFVNNYYMINGQQCKQAVFQRICQDQLCTLPVFTYLVNQFQVVKLQKILLNLSYHKNFQKMLRSSVVGGYLNKIKQNKMQQLSNKIKQAITLHTQSVHLGQLSTFPVQQSTYCQSLKQHIKYYNWYCQLFKKQDINEILTVNNQRSFYNHFQSFIAKSQKIYDIEINYVQNNQTSLEIIRLIIKAHRIMFDLWTQLPCHPDFTAATLRFLMKFLERVYGDTNIYMKSKINSEISPDILYILRKFWTQQKSPNSHDLIEIAISNGFIQFYCRIVKRQHSLMQKYIEKNVENIHMTDNYQPQAQFRLICFYLFLQNKTCATQICQNLIAYQFSSYIVDNMLHSYLTLDLRFYKANDQVVPFRFCHPLRAEAIAMIGYALVTKQCQLSDDISSRLIPHLAAQLKLIDCNNLESLPQKMKWIESLWLLANIVNTDNQRLKYQFINLKLHEGINSQIQKYPFLNNFFPQMTQTIRNSRTLINSLARSQIIKQI